MAQPKELSSAGTLSETFAGLGKAWAEKTLSEIRAIIINSDRDGEQLRNKRLEGLALRSLGEGNPVAVPLLLMVGRFGQSAFDSELVKLQAADDGTELINRAREFAQNGGRIIFPDPKCPVLSYHYVCKPNIDHNSEDSGVKTTLRQMIFSRIEGRGPILEMPNATAMAAAMIKPRAKQS